MTRTPPAPEVACGRCTRFDSRPHAIEAAFPGLASMGSGSASVRAQDGLCALHGRYLPATAYCAAFEAK